MRSYIAGIAAVIVAKINSKSVLKVEISTKTKTLLNEGKIELDKIKGVDTLIESIMSNLERIPSYANDISKDSIESLTKFVEAYRNKVDLLELFGAEIPSDFYYHFALYYAYVRKDHTVGNYFIDKAISDMDHKNNNTIDVLRWAARIKRLNQNEAEATKLLTKVIGLVDSPTFPYKDKYDSVFKARVYRSRGFGYFNKHDYCEAIRDFKSSLNLSNKFDTKLPYSYCGLAMAIYRDNRENCNNSVITEIVEHYETAFQKEPLFYANNIEEFRKNLQHLEAKKHYYFTTFEKESLELINEFYKSQKGC